MEGPPALKMTKRETLSPQRIELFILALNKTEGETHIAQEQGEIISLRRMKGGPQTLRKIKENLHLKKKWDGWTPSPQEN